jgi:soluble lytic murein transglycosylase-like protein
MQRQWINFLLILFSWSLSIHARAILRGSCKLNNRFIVQLKYILANETLLVGQIIGPSDGVVRNLLGMMLSMNVFFNNTILHSSLIPITNSTFPFNYSIVLADRDFELENATNFYIVSMIWQPAYIHAENFNLSEDKVDTHNLEMRAISKYIFYK